MVKRDANIDLLFRNGLEDLEVLPPSDAWDHISPAIRPSREIGWIFRIAAGVAAMVSLGLLAYYVGIRSSENLLETVTADFQEFTGEEVVPENSTPLFSSSTLQESSQADVSAEILAYMPADESWLSTMLIPVNNLTDNPDNVFSVVDVDNSSLRYTNPTPEKLEYIGNSNMFNEAPYGTDLAPQNPVSIEKWKIGAKVSPTYLSSSLKAANQSMNGSIDESALLSYTGGVIVSFKVTSRFSLQTGVYYSSLGRQVSGINSYSGFTPDAGAKSGSLFEVETATGPVSSTNHDIFLTDVTSARITSFYTIDNYDPVKAGLQPFGNELKQNLEYLEIPVMLSYKVIDKRVDFNLLGGLSYNFLLDNNTYAVGDGTKVLIGTTEGVEQIVLSSALGMSLEYSINKNISFNLEPSFRYFLNSDGRISIQNPYTFGIFSGLYYSF